MRTIPATLAARLAAGSTRLAYAWIVRRADGVVLGFTDHDSDLTIEGVRCVAATGLAAKDMTSELGLAPGGGEVLGALQAAAVTEEDIVSGAYDGAEIRVLLCDCEAPFDCVVLDTGTIGEIKRDETAFIAEMRGPAHRLGEELGRLYQKNCDADFGDQRCGVDLKRADLSASGKVDALLAAGRYRVSGLATFTSASFTNGTMTFSQSPDRRFAVKSHTVIGTVTIIDLWLAPEAVKPGDGFTITMGCDKRFDSCAKRFDNAENYRGFPHMPGTEIVLTLVQDGEPGYDGGSLFHA